MAAYFQIFFQSHRILAWYHGCWGGNISKSPGHHLLNIHQESDSSPWKNIGWSSSHGQPCPVLMNGLVEFNRNLRDPCPCASTRPTNKNSRSSRRLTVGGNHIHCHFRLWS